MSDDEKNDEWEWETAGFGRRRPKLELPMKVGKTFEAYMEEQEELQDAEDKKDDQESAARRKFMEHASVQFAQYQLLWSKNKRALEKKKDFKYYPMPKLFNVRPVMPEKMMVELLEKNQALLNDMTELVAKNERIALMDSTPLAEFADLP